MTNRQQPIWKDPTIVAALIAAFTAIIVALIQIVPEQADRPKIKHEFTNTPRPNISGIWLGGTGRYTVTQDGNKVVWDGIGRYGNKVWHHKGKGVIEGDTISAKLYEQSDSNFPGIEGGARTEGSIAEDMQTISWVGQNPQERIWRRSQ